MDEKIVDVGGGGMQALSITCSSEPAEAGANPLARGRGCRGGGGDSSGATGLCGNVINGWSVGVVCYPPCDLGDGGMILLTRGGAVAEGLVAARGEGRAVIQIALTWGDMDGWARADDLTGTEVLVLEPRPDQVRAVGGGGGAGGGGSRDGG